MKGKREKHILKKSLLTPFLPSNPFLYLHGIIFIMRCVSQPSGALRILCAMIIQHSSALEIIQIETNCVSMKFCVNLHIKSIYIIINIGEVLFFIQKHVYLDTNKMRIAILRQFSWRIKTHFNMFFLIHSIASKLHCHKLHSGSLIVFER